MKIDETDRRILKVLQKSGRISNSDLADKINLEKYYNWLSKYPHINKIIKEYDNEVNKDLKSIIGLNKKNW